MAAANRTIQAVVFDLDDTLYGERQYVRSGYRAVAERLGKMTGKDEPFEAWLWQRFLGGQTERAFDALNEQFALGLAESSIDELVTAYREHPPDIRPYEGVPRLLGRLHADYRLGLLSDGFLPAQRLKLEALKLERFFDAVVFTDELGPDAWKPSAAGFEAMCEKLSLPHEACAYVSDNPAKDFIAPNRLGWLTVQFLQAGQIHAQKPAPEGGRPQATVDSPGRLRAALTQAR